jgi:hypothetical protein
MHKRTRFEEWTLILLVFTATGITKYSAQGK